MPKALPEVDLPLPAIYLPEKIAHSEFIAVRGLRYHVHLWGDATLPKLFLFHGWMDVGASFQFLVDAFKQDWHVIAPDWRGFGLSEWPQDGYYFPDYIGDMDAILHHYSPNEPVNLIGHSMGGNVAGLYAGARPEKVKKLIALEGFGLPRTAPDKAPGRYTKWLDELRETQSFRPYKNFTEVAQRLQKTNPRLPDDKAAFLARHWSHALTNGDVVLNSDPRHKTSNPILYRIEEAFACWDAITAPTLWVIADETDLIAKWIKEDDATFALRKKPMKYYSEAIIKNAGHMLHHDQPEALAEIIEQFLDK
ncbi:MAG: alpha/beta hydrolase [Burkholderiales bacterium]